MSDRLSSDRLSFVAVDFETANRRRDSVCQVGLARVRFGRVEEAASWYVIPPTGLDSFEAGNIDVHGITPQTLLTRGALSWVESLARFREFAHGLPLVAHNASFDAAVFRESTTASKQTVPEYRWEDTVPLARRHLSLRNYKLTTVADAFGAGGFSHHDALFDALACAQVVIGISELSGLGSVDELWPRGKAPAANTLSASVKPGLEKYYQRGYATKKSEMPQPNPDADPSHALHGQHVVITGDIAGFSRWEVFEAIARFGGTPQGNVTKKTTVLILGPTAFAHPSHDLASGSSKEKKAHQYRQAGQQIRLLGAQEFRDLL